jgi:two-component system, OmpR family, response regulator MtrA
MTVPPEDSPNGAPDNRAPHPFSHPQSGHLSAQSATHSSSQSMGHGQSGGSASPRGRVLVVDDDASLAEMLSIVLRQEGFDSRVCARGDLALAEFREYRPDVLLLDLMLPGKDGIDVCREVRAESGIPIVMLTAKGDTIDIVLGLESGADDYVVKPFKPKELVARIRARVRRLGGPTPESITIGDLAIDVAGHAVTRDDMRINLTPLEFDLLVCLARKPWQVFTREVLLEQVWGYRHAADTRLVNVHVQRLRAKVEHDPENPEIVLTVRGVGYKAGSS